MARNYCFTWNNPEGILTLDSFDGLASYLVYSEELGANNTYHLQGYVELNRVARITQLYRLVPAHYEVRRGSQKQAIAYCKKNDETTIDGPYEYGEPKAQGERSDLTQIKAEIDAGASEGTIWEDWFAQSVRYHRSFKEYRFIRDQQHPRTEFNELSLFIGGTGLGKSHAARELYPEAYWPSRPSSKGSTFWWDGYTGQDTVVLDEFYGWLSFDILLRLCDKYPLMLQCKGYTVVCKVTRVIITSNTRPSRWYKADVPWDSFLRRITEIRFYYSFAEYNVCETVERLEEQMYLLNPSVILE